jgi:hypothetical protein
LSPDGRELYFFRHTDAQGEDYRIFRSVRSGSTWTAPERIDLGGDYSDLYPSLSPDGSRLVFSSYRPAPGDTSTHHNAHLWMARRRGNGWAKPEFIPASRIGFYHSGLRQDSSGTLHFRLSTPDYKQTRDMDLRWDGTAFSASMIPGESSSAADYWRARSGDTLYVWGGVAGPGNLHLIQISRLEGRHRGPAQYFVTSPRNGAWTPPVPAGGGLGVGSPNFVWFSSDGCYVHYTRDYYEFMRVPTAAVRGQESGGQGQKLPLGLPPAPAS